MTSYVQRFAQDLSELIEAAIRARDVLDPHSPIAAELDAALEPFEGPSVPEVAPAAGEPQEAAQGREEACQGYQSWGGVSVVCERCDLPAWEHVGQEVAANPFTDQGAETVPWSGQMAKVREHYLNGGVVSVREDGSGGKVIQLLPPA